MHVMAGDGASEGRWFINLVVENQGKTFCAPKETTFKEYANVLVELSKTHPELHGQVTNAQAIHALGERYPCSANSTSAPANTQLPQAGVKNVEVAPKGEFASIDTKPTIAIMQKLHATSGNENDDLIASIEKNSGNYMPPVLFALADLLYRQGNTDDAIFWFNAARLRGNIDAAICKDVSARSAIPALVQQIPRDLIKRQFDDLPKLKSLVTRVIDWDVSTPYSYDRLWINLHGMQAINSGLSNSTSTDQFSEPADKWAPIANETREQYRKSLDEAIEFVRKDREIKS